MANSDQPQNIEIDKEAIELLRGSQTELQKILRKKKVSYSQIIKVLYAATHLQDELINMQLEGAEH